jgi:PleD family two-component response regulator
MRHDDNIETLIKRADALLYESKGAGRNHLTMG